MGSPLRLFVAAATDDPGLAGQAWQVVRETFEEADRALSRFRETSDLTAVNRRTGELVDGASRMLVRALTASDRAHRRTGGRFDPRVLADLERLGLRGASLDLDHERPRAVPPGGASRVLQRRGRSGPIRIDAAVDLGGIGKGLALRWAAQCAATGLSDALAAGGGLLVEAGGDIASRGRGPGGSPWLIDIEGPFGGPDAPAVIRLPLDGAVATSSTRLQRWTAPGGRPVHHLIDPRTGEPGGAGLVAVTVAGPDPAWAEVWAKSLFVEGLDGIAALARREGLAAWWAAEDGRFEMTPAARVLTVWLRNERS